jgi:hypothetical protein
VMETFYHVSHHEPIARADTQAGEVTQRSNADALAVRLDNLRIDVERLKVTAC